MIAMRRKKRRSRMKTWMTMSRKMMPLMMMRMMMKILSNRLLISPIKMEDREETKQIMKLYQSLIMINRIMKDHRLIKLNIDRLLQAKEPDHLPILMEIQGIKLNLFNSNNIVELNFHKVLIQENFSNIKIHSTIITW